MTKRNAWIHWVPMATYCFHGGLISYAKYNFLWLPKCLSYCLFFPVFPIFIFESRVLINTNWYSQHLTPKPSNFFEYYLLDFLYLGAIYLPFIFKDWIINNLIPQEKYLMFVLIYESFFILLSITTFIWMYYLARTYYWRQSYRKLFKDGNHFIFVWTMLELAMS